MTDLRKETVETYNTSARELSEYFRGIGPRTDDIDLALKLAGDPINPKIIEIGCGDGRDAKEITKRTNWYLGFDISEGMIELAEKHVPEAMFEVADAVNFKYPPEIDIIFSFASLLHLNKDELQTVFENVHESLQTDGIFFASTKYSPQYREVIKEDQYGKRLFYFYNQQILESIAGPRFKTVYSHLGTIATTEWLEIAFQRQ